MRGPGGIGTVLHPLCLSHAEALPFSDSCQYCPSLGNIHARIHDFFKRSHKVLQGAISGRQVLKTGGMQAMPMLEKRQGGRERLTCLPTLALWGVGHLGRESWGWHSLMQGWVLSVSLKRGQSVTLLLSPMCSPSGLMSYAQWNNFSESASRQQH